MPGFLLDTNVVSEMVRPQSERRVLDWMAGQLPANLYLSAVTFGELIRGVRRLPAGQRRDRLQHWVEVELSGQFDGRILPFDRQAAALWGGLMAASDRRGRPLAAIDAQIAATALLHDLVMATRDVADFGAARVPVVNPWRD